MKIKLIVSLLAAVALNAHATVVNFDGLGDRVQVSNGYAGFNWLGGGSGLYSIDKNAHPTSGYFNGTTSGSRAVYNAWGVSGNIISLAGPGTFKFNGAYWTSAWTNQSIWFSGFKGGKLVYSSDQFALDTKNPLWIGLNWTDIDQLQIFHNQAGNTHWAMDDFTFNEETKAVSAPGALALIGLGFAGLVLRRRQK